jgi:hypothetical protein
MSDDTEDESTDGSGQQSADSDQPSAQPDEQPAEQTDQSTEQSEEQPVEGDQPVQQAEEEPAADEQPSSEDQATDQPQEQPTNIDESAQQAWDSDQVTTSADADDAVAMGGGSGDTAKTSARKVKVIAEFTEGGEKFIGEIKVLLFEYDKNGVSSQVWDQGDWQDTVVKSNVITTPTVPFTTSQLAVTANARILMGMGSYQIIANELVFPMPSGDTLRVKFAIGLGQVDETVTASDADLAKSKVFQMPKFKGKFVSLDAQPLGNQKFHVTGKYATGGISSPDGRAL